MYVCYISNSSEKFHELVLFSDDTNFVYSDKNLNSFEHTVNIELINACMLRNQILLFSALIRKKLILW